jgi:hypothetical protein
VSKNSRIKPALAEIGEKLPTNQNRSNPKLYKHFREDGTLHSMAFMEDGHLNVRMFSAEGNELVVESVQNDGDYFRISIKNSDSKPYLLQKKDVGIEPAPNLKQIAQQAIAKTFPAPDAGLMVALMSDAYKHVQSDAQVHRKEVDVQKMANELFKNFWDRVK